jgi:hypothetical protein
MSSHPLHKVTKDEMQQLIKALQSTDDKLTASQATMDAIKKEFGGKIAALTARAETAEEALQVQMSAVCGACLMCGVWEALLGFGFDPTRGCCQIKRTASTKKNHLGLQQHPFAPSASNGCYIMHAAILLQGWNAYRSQSCHWSRGGPAGTRWVRRH